MNSNGVTEMSPPPLAPYEATPLSRATQPSSSSVAAPPHINPVAAPLTSSQAGEDVPLRVEDFAACTSAAEILRCFSASSVSFSSQTTPSSLSISRTPVANDASSASVMVRAALVAHLSDVLQRGARRPTVDSPATSLACFLVFLVVAGPDIVRAVRQRCEASSAFDSERQTRGLARTPHKEQHTAAAPDALSLHSVVRAHVHDALACLRRCTAYAVAEQHLRRPTPIRTKAVFHRDDIFSSLPACSALDRLRSCADGRASGSSDNTNCCADTPYWCSTGCEGLDRVLGGAGFRSGWVTEVYGEAGAGKTQLSLQLLLQQAATDLCRSAVALCLANNTTFTSLPRQGGGSAAAAACRRSFDVSATEALRCAAVYLVSEDVPTSRLGPLATAAARRATRAMELHPLLTQLPSAVMESVRRAVRQTCTSTMVLSRLQIRHIASLQEVLQLVGPADASHSLPVLSSGSGVGSGAQRKCSLTDAVRMLSGSDGRAVVVLDSIAAAVSAGRSDVHGAAHADASVTSAALQLRRVAAAHNWCVVVMNQVRSVPQSARAALSQMSLGRTKRRRSPADTSSRASFSGADQTVVPALGTAWAAAALCRVQLRKTLSPGVRQLLLRHSPADPPSRACYCITADGMEDA